MYPLINICVFGILINIVLAQYKLPQALLEPIYDRGFRVSIPDVRGIQLFSFHGKLNEPMNGRENGNISRNILKPKDGRWTFIDTTTPLEPGDTIYYWVYVEFLDDGNTLSFINDDQQHLVTAFIQNDTVSYTTTESNNKPIKCPQSATLVNGKKTCGGKIIFQENFGDSFPNKWDHEVKFAAEPDYEFVEYTNRESVISANDNMLYIKPKFKDDIYGPDSVRTSGAHNLGENCTGIPGSLECVQNTQGDWELILPPVISGRINTKNHFNFLYGTIEIRAKLLKGDWLYPQLFLTPKEKAYGDGYDSGQFRLGYVPGNDIYSHNMRMGMILGSSPEARQHYMFGPTAYSVRWSDSFYVFSIKWEPGKISFFLDGSLTRVIRPYPNSIANSVASLGLSAAEKWSKGTALAPFDKEMYIEIGVGAGGHTFFDAENRPWKNNDPKAQKQFYNARDKWRPTWGEDSQLEVDYVKVYSL